MELRSDRRGRVPFAVIGVLVLVTASGAGVYLGSTELDTITAQSASDNQEYLARVCGDELARISAEAESAAAEATESAASTASGETPDSLFAPAMEAWFCMRYPRDVGGVWVNATLNSCILIPCTARVPAVDGGSSATAPWETQYYLEVSVECASDTSVHTANESVSGRVPARRMLCDSIAGMLADALAPGGPVERRASVLLSVLAAKRLSEGWGFSEDAPDLPQVVTAEEARRAFGVAARAACVEACGVDPVTGARCSGRYDACDVFLSELGEDELDTSLILAQSLAGMLDQLLIKYYDWLSLAGGLEEIFNLLETVEGWLESAWGWLTGDGTEAAMASAAVEWVRDLVVKAGVDPSLLELDAPVHLTYILPSPSTYTVANTDGEDVTYSLSSTLAIDLLPYDLLDDDRWGELFPLLSQSYDSGAPSLSHMMNSLIDGLARSGASSIQLGLVANDSTPALEEVANALRRALSDGDLLRTAVLNAAGMFLDGQGSILTGVGRWMEENAHWMGDGNERARESLERSLTALVDASPPDGLDALSRQRLIDTMADSIWDENGTRVESDYSYAIQDRLCEAAEAIASACIRVGDARSGWLIERVVDMVLDGVPGVAPLSEWLDERVSRFGTDFIDAVAVGGGDSWVVPSTGMVVTSRWSGESQTGVSIAVGCSGLDNLSVTVKGPGECDGSVHYTSPSETSPTPYTNVWRLSVAGNLTFLVSIAGETASESRCLASELDVRAASLWALEGVDYSPTSTLGGDALKFFLTGFREMVPALSRAFEFAREAWDILNIDVVPWLMTDGADLVEKLADLQLTLAGDLQDVLRSAASKALALLLEALLGHLEDATFGVSLYGIPLTIRTLPDMPGPRRFLVVDAVRGDGEADLRINLELIDLGNDTLDIVLRIDASGPSGWYLLAADPLMESLPAMVSLQGAIRGIGFDIVLPTVDQHRTMEVSLQDVPGLGQILSNIRIPNLGISADVDVGISIDYSPPSANHVVVNEYEADPPGIDIGNEVVELYNPLPVEVRLDGWTLETMGGQTSVWELSGSIPPYAATNVTFGTQALDNDGDGVVLRNAGGTVVDSTPVFRDETDSGMDWQRERDGWGAWVWAKSTLGRPQGAGDLNDSLIAPLVDALERTINETVAELMALEALDIDAVMRVARGMLDSFEARASALIEGQVRRASLFIDLIVKDLTGSGGMGYRIEVAIDGKGCAEAFRWLAARVKEILGLAVSADAGELAFSSPAWLMPHLSVSVSNLVELETPSQLPAALDGAQLPLKLQGRETVSFNLPLVGMLADRDWGPWVATVGLRVMDFPAQAASLILPVDERLPVELWLFRAVLYEA